MSSWLTIAMATAKENNVSESWDDEREYKGKSYEAQLFYELTLPLRRRDAEIARLRAELAELERKYSEAVDLNMRQAMTSDAMKLELILSGALTTPKAKTEKT